MAIRVRRVGDITIACCAVETDPEPGDLYLDDAVHYALAAKFARDWRGATIDWSYPADDAANATQVKRDACEEHRKWAMEYAGGPIT